MQLHACSERDKSMLSHSIEAADINHFSLVDPRRRHTPIHALCNDH